VRPPDLIGANEGVGILFERKEVNRPVENARYTIDIINVKMSGVIVADV
jgi:hypothetical protein